MQQAFPTNNVTSTVNGKKYLHCIQLKIVDLQHNVDYRTYIETDQRKCPTTGRP